MLAKVTRLEAAEAARVEAEAGEAAVAAATAVAITSLEERADEADSLINTTNTRLHNLMISAADELDSLETLVDWIYKDYTATQSFTELIANGRFEDEDGGMARVSDVGLVQSGYGRPPMDMIPGDPPFAVVVCTLHALPTCITTCARINCNTL